jgi:hypothetical protein
VNEGYLAGRSLLRFICESPGASACGRISSSRARARLCSTPLNPPVQRADAPMGRGPSLLVAGQFSPGRVRAIALL